MDLVLCHTTADFDTLGAAVGLTRLHPGARIVLTGGAHPAVRDFLALHRDEYALIERRSVNPEQIRSITVVDTQFRNRVDSAAEWLDLPNIEISVYDHHLEMESDIPAAHRWVEAVGATTTLVVEQLQAKKIVPNPVEATGMALGIHVDTGSLTFDQTTVRDARALAWLMECGANVRTIASYIRPGLSPELQPLLPLAMDLLQTETVNGQTIAWVLLTLDGFIPGLSGLVSQLMDLTDFDGLLLAAQYPKGNADDDSHDALTVIGRSRIDGTNLNELFKPFGGGGHARAAAVNLRPADPSATLAQLVAQFKAQIPSPPTARELMSSPVRTIRPETTIADAQRILLRYGHSGLSVVNAAGQLIGVISRRDLDIALHHGFSHAPVKGYMTTNLKTITPETLLPDIESLMVTYDIGRLPVLDDGELVGIVTRTDVLRQWHQQERRVAGFRAAMGRGTDAAPSEASDASAIEVQSARPYTRPPTPGALLAALRPCLKAELWQLLSSAAAQAEQRGWHMYLVGGAVRDLLLAIANGTSANGTLLIEDIDLVVDGFHHAADAGAGVELARSLQSLYPTARLDVHGKFQTAALLWHNDPTLKSLWVDIATARTEFYPYPAANPEVEASSIRQDLYRRDFTINAMAVRLTHPHAGELLDFFGGVLDLEARQIRVLHANSFIEDPTRIYRAVRFAVRLGFQIDTQTEGYIRHAMAIGIYAQIQDRRQAQSIISAPALQTRLKSELKHILQSPYWPSALQKLANLDALQCIHPTLSMSAALWRQLRLVDRWLCGSRRQTLSGSPGELASRHPAPWLVLLEVIIAHLAPEYRGLVAENLQLPSDSIDRLQQLAAVQTHLATVLPACNQPSEIVRVLKPYNAQLLALIAVRNGYDQTTPRALRERSMRRKIWQYLTDWATIKPPLDGNDLKGMGYKPGPQFRSILDALSAATLDGVIQTRAEAETYVKQRFPELQ